MNNDWTKAEEKVLFLTKHFRKQTVLAAVFGIYGVVCVGGVDFWMWTKGYPWLKIGLWSGLMVAIIIFQIYAFKTNWRKWRAMKVVANSLEAASKTKSGIALEHHMDQSLAALESVSPELCKPVDLKK